MSLFYTTQFEQLFPIPLIAFEHLNTLQSLPPETALAKVLAECCHKPNPTDLEVNYFLSRVQQDSEKAQKRLEEQNIPGAKTTPTKSLGTAFQEFLRQLDSARLLLWACRFDFEKAKYLYTQADSYVANQIIEDFLRLQNERNNYLFEAALYGFGGKYSNDGADAGEIDMTEMDAADIMAMFQL